LPGLDSGGIKKYTCRISESQHSNSRADEFDCGRLVYRISPGGTCKAFRFGTELSNGNKAIPRLENFDR